MNRRFIVVQEHCDYVIYQEDFNKKSKALRAFRKVTKDKRIRKFNRVGAFHTQCYEQKYNEKERKWEYKKSIISCVQRYYRHEYNKENKDEK